MEATRARRDAVYDVGRACDARVLSLLESDDAATVFAVRERHRARGQARRTRRQVGAA